MWLGGDTNQYNCDLHVDNGPLYEMSVRVIGTSPSAYSIHYTTTSQASSRKLKNLKNSLIASKEEMWPKIQMGIKYG